MSFQKRHFRGSQAELGCDWWLVVGVWWLVVSDEMRKESLVLCVNVEQLPFYIDTLADNRLLNIILLRGLC